MFSEETPVDVKHLTVSFVSMISIIGFFMWLTYVGTNERADMHSRLEVIEKNITSMSAQLKNTETWSKNDHILFCLRSQLLNKGWLCPETDYNMKFGNLNQMNSSDLIQEIGKLEKEQRTLTNK